MTRFLADENFRSTIVRGLLRREPGVDVLTVQELGMTGSPDPDILEWAAQEGRVVLTHDLRTMPAYAYERVRQGKTMPGVVEVDRKAPLGRVIEDLLVFIECSFDGEWEGQVIYLPF